MTELERILEDFGNHVYAKALGHKVWGIKTAHTQIKNYCQEQVIAELEFICERDFVGKDYKGDDCISLKRIQDRIKAIKGE